MKYKFSAVMINTNIYRWHNIFQRLSLKASAYQAAHLPQTMYSQLYFAIPLLILQFTNLITFKFF